MLCAHANHHHHHPHKTHNVWPRSGGGRASERAAHLVPHVALQAVQQRVHGPARRGPALSVRDAQLHVTVLPQQVKPGQIQHLRGPSGFGV